MLKDVWFQNKVYKLFSFFRTSLSRLPGRGTRLSTPLKPLCRLRRKLTRYKLFYIFILKVYVQYVSSISGFLSPSLFSVLVEHARDSLQEQRPSLVRLSRGSLLGRAGMSESRALFQRTLNYLTKIC